MTAAEIDKLQERVEKAIDALVDLEGTVYPTGLPGSLRSALSELRPKCHRLQEDSDRAHDAEDDARMIKSVVDGALEAQAPDISTLFNLKKLVAYVDMGEAESRTVVALTDIASGPHLRKKGRKL